MIRSTLLSSLGFLALLTACPGDSGETDTDAATTGTTADTTTTPTSTDGSTTGTPIACDVCKDYGAAVPKVASDITDKAATDAMFMADFAPLVAMGAPAVDAFKASLTAFISDAYGCSTGTYTGPTMEEAHTGLGITQAEYDAFIGLIAGVLVDNGVPEAYVNECFAPALVDPAFAGTIIGK